MQCGDCHLLYTPALPEFIDSPLDYKTTWNSGLISLKKNTHSTQTINSFDQATSSVRGGTPGHTTYKVL